MDKKRTNKKAGGLSTFFNRSRADVSQKGSPLFRKVF